MYVCLANDSVLKATAVHLTDVKYHGQTSSSQPSQKQHNCYQLTTVKTNVPDDSSYAYAYATASVQGRSQNKDLNDGSVKVSVPACYPNCIATCMSLTDGHAYTDVTCMLSSSL